MSSKAILDNIIIVNNPSLFTDRINIQVTFSVTEPLSEPLQWNITYVGSAMSEDYDQVLEEFEVGPVDENSTLQFNIECDAPDA